MHHLRDWIWERLRRWRTFKGLQPSKPHWLYPIWTAAVVPKPPAAAPPTASTTFTFIFSFTFIRHTLVIPHKVQIANKRWSLRQGVFSFCLRTYNLMKTPERNGPEQTGQWNIRPAKRAITKWTRVSGESRLRRWCLLGISCLILNRVLKFQIWPPLFGIFLKCGYMGGVVGVLWERLERLYPLFLFYLFKVFPRTL